MTQQNESRQPDGDDVESSHEEPTSASRSSDTAGNRVDRAEQNVDDAGDFIDARGSAGLINRPNNTTINQNIYPSDEKYEVHGLANPYLGLDRFTYKTHDR